MLCIWCLAHFRLRKNIDETTNNIKMDQKTVFWWEQFSTDFAKDFCKYYKSRKFSDIKLCLDDGEIFYAHKILLANASSYFHRILDNGQDYGPKLGETIVLFIYFRSSFVR